MSGLERGMLGWSGAFCAGEAAREKALYHADQLTGLPRGRGRKREDRQPRTATPPEAQGKRGPRFCALFYGVSFFERGPARNRVVFINSGRGRGKKGALAESRGAADLALFLRSFSAAKCEGRELPPKDALLMKTTRFLAGTPSFSATEARRRVPLAQTSARKRAEQPRAGD